MTAANPQRELACSAGTPPAGLVELLQQVIAMQHALRTADWATWLGGAAEVDPIASGEAGTAGRGTCQGPALVAALRESLAAERVIINSYLDLAVLIGQTDESSRMLVETILDEERDHADDLRELIRHWDRSNGPVVDRYRPTRGQDMSR